MNSDLKRARWVLVFSFAAAGAWALEEKFTADPTDPLYPPTANSQGCSVPGSPTCIDPPGQWDLFSFSPTVPATAHPSGISVDRAWRVTTGRPDVEVAVFDTGVNYDHVDLRNQIWLNRGELPRPAGPDCAAPASDPYDCNNDGVFNVRDYQGDARITDTLLPGTLSRSDLRVFEDGVDGDGNGYVDDISGFDFDDVDGDEYDHRDFGHGTGRNGFIAAEPNNGQGIAGICPNCRIANARIEDTFVVVRSETTANAAIWAADHGFELINMALGHVGASSMSRKAFEYAYSRNVLPMSAIANEFHFHHGYVGLYDEVMAIGAITYAGATTAGIAPNNGQPTQAPSTYLRKANYSNYGAHLQLVAPSESLTTHHAKGGSSVPSGCTSAANNCFGDSSGTSSAVPHAVGVGALVYSQARNMIAAGTLNAAGLALRDISNQEVRQVLIQTADDIRPSDDAAAGTYPVLLGWDKWTGYGRVNAKKAVDLVAAGKIPPEADINSPDWYSYVSGVVTVKFYANNRWRGNYNWVLEQGAGVEPGSFTTVASGSAVADPSKSSTDLVNNLTAEWDTSRLADGGHTLRLRVTDAVDNTLVAEDRMFVWVRRGLVDGDNHPGFPLRIARTFNGETIPVSAESMSNALVDLDGDNKLEIVLATGDGEVRAYRENGTLMPGFPVMTQPLAGLPGNRSEAFDGDFSNGEVPVTGASIAGGVAVGDMDLDGIQEICTGAVDGKVYCWNADGSVQPGFPVSADAATFREQYSGEQRPVASGQPEAIVAPPTLQNLDGDDRGTLEILAVSRDQKLYAWKSDGSRLGGFPVTLGTPDAKAPRGSISGILVADIDNDGQKDIVVGTNETAGSTPNTSGRVYAFKRDGTPKAGWPVQPASAAADGVPIVAQGVVNGPLAANFDSDAQLEIATSAFLGDIVLYNHDGSQLRTLSGSHTGSGTAQDRLEETATVGSGRQDDAPVRSYVGLGAIADFNSTSPGLEYLAGTVGNNLVVNVAGGSGAVTSFDHYLSAWNTATGAHLPGFPRFMEGWQFLTGPAIGDIGGTAGPEAIVGSSGLFIHAFNASGGAEPAGWPKFTGNWHVNTPSIADIDDDGDLEVVSSSRLGQIHVWNTAGPACAAAGSAAPWRKFRHDEWNTGAVGTDTLRPAKVSDLVRSQAGGQVVLKFTAVGDDGRCGTAVAYEVLANCQPVRGLPTPKAAGNQEVLTFAGTPSTDVELRVRDEAGNLSPALASGRSSCVSGGGAAKDSGGGLPAQLLVVMALLAICRRLGR